MQPRAAELTPSMTAHMSMVCVQVRDFYFIELKGTGIENPGWDDAVCGVLSALSQLVGEKAQHVPQVHAEAEYDDDEEKRKMRLD